MTTRLSFVFALLVLSAALVHAQNGDAVDASQELAALGRKCQAVNSVRVVWAGLEKEKDKSWEEARLFGTSTTWFDKRRGLYRGEGVKSTTVTNILVTKVGTIAWTVLSKTRQPNPKGIVLIAREEYQLKNKSGTLPLALGPSAFAADALDGYPAVLKTFEVTKGAAQPPSVDNAVWFTLTPRPGTPFADRSGHDPMRFQLALDMETGLPAAFASLSGKGQGALFRVLLIETDPCTEGVFRIPPQVRKLGVRDERTGEPVELPED